MAAAPATAPGAFRAMTVPQAQVRTWEEMAAFGTATAARSRTVPSPVVIPLRPAVNPAVFQAAKVQARTRAAAAMAALAGQAAKKKAATLPPKVKSQNYEGINSVKAGNLLPPDTHGAVGLSHFVQITNSHLDIYLKKNHKRVKSVSLANFFGWTQSILFDPRVVYDQEANRWIISADAFADPKTTGQHHWLAVSLTSDPTGAYYIYAIPVSDGTAFWDFPQVGVDQNAIIITANMFDSADEGGSFTGSSMLVIPKDQAYSGIAPPLVYYINNIAEASLAPPIVLDNNPNTFLVSAQTPLPGTPLTSVSLYTLDTSADPPTLSGPVAIAVDPFELPPDAVQYRIANVFLDTMDCRFSNASTQVGNSLFQVHTINDGSGFARPRYYEFDVSDPNNPAVLQSGVFARSASSYDFNASITANAEGADPAGQIFVTWSATDPLLRVNAEVRFSGRQNGDPIPGIASPGVRLVVSSSFYNPSGVPQTGTITERWGDYSAITIDPADPTKAWLVNEKIYKKTSWGSRIARIGY